MQALILETDTAAQARVGAVLMDKGFHVMCVESIGAARAFLGSGLIDLMFVGDSGLDCGEGIEGLIGLAPPGSLALIVMTERKDIDVDGLVQKMPKFYGTVGRAIPPGLIGQLALSAVADVDTDASRVRRKAFLGTITPGQGARRTALTRDTMVSAAPQTPVVPPHMPRPAPRSEPVATAAAPVTPAQVTPAQATPASVTSAPVTSAPVTSAPVTSAPVTPAVLETADSGSLPWVRPSVPSEAPGPRILPRGLATADAASTAPRTAASAPTPNPTPIAVPTHAPTSAPTSAATPTATPRTMPLRLPIMDEPRMHLA